MQGKSFDEIYDIYAVRIIVDDVIDCYNCLGIIHDMFKSIPGRFKDYISTPKANMYQSLHTTVIGDEGIPFEVQIRTWEMHRTAEYGVAAHWKYKLGMSGRQKFEEKFSWIRQLLESQNVSENPQDIVNTIKTDLVQEEVFVFTPKGTVINLPAGATVVDFAYAIHSAVGNRMVGAKINGKIVPIDYKLKTGDIGELTEDNQLFITGRVKNLIILSNGENVSPEAIEKKFADNQLVSEVLVYDEKDRIIAEIYPDYEYAKLEGIDDIQGELEKAVDRMNKTAKAAHIISEVRVRTEPLEKTGSGKIKRKATVV
jgi:acyl-CoA synthetase (AMP-forming)/AMP-acid ligase II